MGFGQYNTTTKQPRRSKRTMLSELDRFFAERVTASTQPARNTLRAELDDGGVIWVLHETIVFQRHANGAITLNTGGWNSMTTRDRINMALRMDGPPGRFSVYTSRGIIYLARRGHDGQAFRERVTMGPRGGNANSDLDAGEAERDRKLIDAYMKAWRATPMQDMLDSSAGDPWVFATDHGRVPEYVMRDWLVSKYCHARLALLALESSGRSNAGQIIQYFPRDILDQAVRRYARACLGYASS